LSVILAHQDGFATSVFPALRWRTNESHDTIPYTHHPYQYSLSDPVNLTDPSGRDPWWYEDPHPNATVRSGSAYEEIEAHDRRCHERDYLETISGRDPGPCDANVLIDYPHESLDAIGMVEGVGAVADIANAALYCIEGDFANAGLSAAAAVPVLGVGATAAKWGIRVVDVSRGLKFAGRFEALSDFEVLVAQSLAKRGDAIIGLGDDGVRQVLGLSRGRQASIAADFLSVTPSGRYNITEVKASFRGYVNVSHAKEQIKTVVDALKSKVPGAKLGTLEIAIPKGARLEPPYGVSGNQLVIITETGKEVVRVEGSVVIIKEIP
jgi:hypothetical protein